MSSGLWLVFGVAAKTGCRSVVLAIESGSERRKKLANMMRITEEELGKLRRDTFAGVAANIVTNYRHENLNGKVAVDHHGDHRSVEAGSYSGVKLDMGEPVSFGF